MSTHRFMRHSLHLFSYKIQTRQPLSADSINAHETFKNAVLQKLDACKIDVGNSWFSEKAYFPLDNFVNKHNWCIWGTENLHIAVPSSAHPSKVIVWDAISSRGLIGPFFRRQMITAAKHLHILHEFVATQNALEDYRNSSWFMQDGARPHQMAEVFDFLGEYFDDYVVALDYEIAYTKWHGFASLFTRFDAM
ncbi:hypothetical protein AVEN_225200-1 [Araneus ventricosus]|uniref:Uncharacterized protein n=1 Tax=Araneus ventricosus TaxID=182803 RepID=A0A4Y2AKW9_ARAVE|nr:hypothetical protein AVEN_225200-1 [Araneus ventricosus]